MIFATMIRPAATLAHLLTVVGSIAVSVAANAGAPNTLSPTDEKNHTLLVQQLSSEQIAALNSVYPDFRLLRLCPGRFSGADRDELVLGLWKPVEAKDPWKREVHRVGLIWEKKDWVVHFIDDEIEKDKNLSRSFPMHWQYSLTNDGFAADMKCGIDGEFAKNSQLTHTLGDKPFFDLGNAGLASHKITCFSTDAVYNNWDCVVFSPKDSRFRLWYQQAHAD